MPEALSYCGDQVRRLDPDRFSTVLFAPPDRREALFAVLAFNLEIAKTWEVVSEPLIGRIRLQWWRDAVAEIYETGAPRRHAVLGALADAIRTHALPRESLDRLIDAREADLEPEPMPDLAALEAYAEATTAPLIRLQLQALGALSPGSAEAGRHAGAAWALVGLLRAIPFHARRRRLVVPRRLLEAHGVDVGELLSFKPVPGLPAAVREVAGRAAERVARARAARPRPPRRALPPLLVATLAEMYGQQLKRCGFQVFDERIGRPHPRRAWSLLGRAAVGRC